MWLGQRWTSLLLQFAGTWYRIRSRDRAEVWQSKPMKRLLLEVVRQVRRESADGEARVA